MRDGQAKLGQGRGTPLLFVAAALLLIVSLVLTACGDNPTPQVVVVTATPPPTINTTVAATPTTTTAATTAPTTLATSAATNTASTTDAVTTTAAPTTAPTTDAATTPANPSNVTPTATVGNSSAKTGPELMGQSLAVKDNSVTPSEFDVRVTGVENFGQVTYSGKPVTPGPANSTFLVLFYDAVNLGKNTISYPSNAFTIQDSKGQLYKTSTNSQATVGIESLNATKYRRISQIQPGTMIQTYALYEVPNDASNFKLVPATSRNKSSRTASPDDFKITTAANNDTVGKELVGQMIAAHDNESKPDELDVRVTGVENFNQLVSGSGSDAKQVRPDAANTTFVVMLYDIVNLGKSPIRSQTIYFNIQDDKGRNYLRSSDIDAEVAVQELDSKKYPDVTEVSPGTVVKAFELYEVPSDAANLKLVVTNDQNKSPRTPSPNDFNLNAAASSGSDNGAAVDTSKLGQELVGQMIAVDDGKAKASVRVVAVEAKNQIKYKDKTATPGGTFLVVIEDVANVNGKASASPINYTELLDDKNRKITYSENSDASIYLNELDPLKYPDNLSVSPGFVRRVTIVFDVPKDAANFKFQANNYFKTARKPGPDDFNNSGGAGPDSNAGQELVGKTFSSQGADFTVTKVQRLTELTIGGKTAAKTDGVFVVVGFNVNNKGTNDVSGLNMRLVDDQGRPYYGILYLGASFDFAKDFPQSGSLKAGSTGTSYALYEIPKDATNLTLQSKYNS